MGPGVRRDDGGVFVGALRIFRFNFQTATLPRSRGAKRPRFASPPQTARGDGAVGGARAPMGTPRGGINVPTSRGKATARAQGKAQRLPALHQPPGHRPFRGAPVRPAFALSKEGSLLESGPHRTGHGQDKAGSGDGDKEYEKIFLLSSPKDCRHPEVLAAQRRASKDRPQATAPASILRDVAQERGSSG
jgi:hypothetical protein